MRNIWSFIYISGTIIGLAIMTKSYIKMRTIVKQFDKMDENELVPEDAVNNLIRYLNLDIIGVCIWAIAALIGVFSR